MINVSYRLKSPKFFEEDIDEMELDGVIVRPTYLSICQADQRYYQGLRPIEVLEKKLPMALIHEGIGEVVFDCSSNFNVGDKVVMIPNTPQGEDVYRANYSRRRGGASAARRLRRGRARACPQAWATNLSAWPLSG